MVKPLISPKIAPTVQMLKEVKILQPFTEVELAHLIKIGSSQSYEAYTNIVIEGEQSWGLYFILEGAVGIFKTNKLSGNFYDVGQLNSGSFFGEMSLIDEGSRSATVRAQTNCQLFYIAKEPFQNFLSQSKELKSKFLESCIKNLVARLRELDDNYVISQYQLWKSALKKEVA